ncbi:methyl jasmonate esterase 1-like [Rhodamnia argentea]|uniref:Methyl jasmonate esterase 1-like n=1 Tax=Rhodamnia argentea TaxID=178133 RepID=A0A8B8NKV5_9MYRT|nr:methyl jasmonate esterase 1-like [Rhodamnia argentea]
MDKKKLNLASLALLILFLFCLEQNEASFESKHFVLVHGSGHGAWCWYKVAKLLRSSGHRVTALDLAASGIDPLQAKSLQSISEYFKPLRDVMEGLASHERVILVGHSLGGLALSQVMEKFPEKIALAVFVTASMPGPELNISTLNQESLRRSPPVLDSHYTYDSGPNNPPTTFSFGPIFLASTVYQLSPIEDLTLASMLLRPLRLFSDEDMSKQITLSRKNYGSVRRIFVLSEEDKLFPKDLAEWMIERNPPDEVLKTRGSDHMVMMSKPTELVAILQETARKYW